MKVINNHTTYNLHRSIATSLKFFILVFTLCSFFNGLALVKIPELTKPVIDQANLLSIEQETQLEQQIRSAYSTGKIQTQILTILDLDGEAIEDFSIRAVEKWKLGHAKEDNGVLILVAKKQRKVRIEIGSGLEGLITDIQSHIIIKEQLTPAFKKGQFAQGFSLAIKEINTLAKVPLSKSSPLIKKKAAPHFFAFFPFIVMILLNFIFSFSKGQKKTSIVRGLITAGLCSLLLINKAPWPVLAVLGVFGFFVGFVGFHSSSSSSSGNGSFSRRGAGNWNSGRGSSWGGSGGGFSGGGASGDW